MHASPDFSFVERFGSDQNLCFVFQGELEEAIRKVMTAKPFFLEVNDAQVQKLMLDSSLCLHFTTTKTRSQLPKRLSIANVQV